MIPVVLFSLTAHEYSHGRIAFLLGDNTAQRLGRLSFNPLKHLDPIGTLFYWETIQQKFWGDFPLTHSSIWT